MLFYILCSFKIFLDTDHFQLSILCYIQVFLYKYRKNSFENIRTDVKIGIFPIPITYWSGFRIFKQNRGNPDEIGMVGQSE